MQEEDKVNEFMAKPDEPLPTTELEERIRNDFEFVGELQSEKIGDKVYLKDKKGNFLNAQVRMSESEFINKWLDGFTLGRVGRNSYFDFNTWLDFTNHGTESVLIVDDNDPSKIIFVIPPIAIPVMDLEERVVLAAAGKRMAKAKYAVENKDNHGANKMIAEATDLIKKYIKDESVHLSTFIPREYFEKYNIIPEVRRDLIYCRDVFGLNSAFPEDWAIAETIFEKIYYHEELLPEEIKFMGILCGDKWTKPTYSGEAPKRPEPNDLSQNKVLRDNAFNSVEPIAEATIIEDPFEC